MFPCFILHLSLWSFLADHTVKSLVNVNTLCKGEPGKKGRSKHCHGASADDTVIPVSVLQKLSPVLLCNSSLKSRFCKTLWSANYGSGLLLCIDTGSSLYFLEFFHQFEVQSDQFK